MNSSDVISPLAGRKFFAVAFAVLTVALTAGVATEASAQSSRGQRVASRAPSTQMIVNRIAFDGNSKIKGENLRPEMQTKAGFPYNEAVARADVQRITEIYHRTGRGLAQVTLRLVPLDNNRVDVVFMINEGSKTPVLDINFVGNNNFSGYRLRNQMNTTEGNFLSFLKTSDVYDPDKLNSDLELIRRYYLKNGYADFRVVSNDVRFDQNRGGYIVTITVDEGPQYRVGNVRVDSRVPSIPEDALAGQVRTRTGDVYNADSVERSLVGMTNEASRRGLAFTQVRPQGNRNVGSHTIDLAYVVDEGPRVYIERINIRGNTRSQDFIIRREFDVVEGDAYNKVLIDRAERRLNNLGHFKRVRIVAEPGSTPDRVVLNVEVEDQPTGSFSVAAGYSTSDGAVGEVSLTESNFLGRGQYVRLAGTYGQRTRGVDFSFTEPFFMDRRLAAGFDLFWKDNDETQYSLFKSQTVGGTLRLGVPITEELSLGLRYSLYQSKITVPNDTKQPYFDCQQPIPGYTGFNASCPATAGLPLPGSTVGGVTYVDPIYNGEASNAVKQAQGKTLTSLAGYTLAYNSLDNIKDPRNGLYAEIRQDFAGLGGDSRFMRSSFDAKYYYEVYEDIVGIARVQGGHIMGFGGKDLRILDHYFIGPSLVRGFAPSGIGPRDISLADPSAGAIGGKTYFGGSVEMQFPFFGLPREVGIRGAVFADAGTVFGNESGVKTGAQGTFFGVTCDVRLYNVGGQPVSSCIRDSKKIRSSVGASILWNSPLGPIRFDYAWALSKDKMDRTQAFRFSGGTRF
ncbi:MAG: outer membrane protein assembly factor BamA [Rhizobiales bacterium 65-9]|nr:outer membrane protein assembly factor BamA [Hyphomicrobiales bacterium]OJY35374.1 MAG: outer membrane protein assembly factor BamA [Rhizobiales bacterium 65-9]